MHRCVSNLTIIGSYNGLSPGRGQAIIWTNAGILLIGPLGTNFSDILIEIHTFSFKEMHLKTLSGKWWPFCLGLNVLRWQISYITQLPGILHILKCDTSANTWSTEQDGSRNTTDENGENHSWLKHHLQWAENKAKESWTLTLRKIGIYYELRWFHPNSWPPEHQLISRWHGSKDLGFTCPEMWHHLPIYVQWSKMNGGTKLER